MWNVIRIQIIFLWINRKLIFSISPRYKDTIEELFSDFFYEEEYCNDFFCQNGGTCIYGQKNYTKLVKFPLTPFLNETSIDGKYCDCNESNLHSEQNGYTGVTCDIHYTLCDDFTHMCFNGATCSPDVNDQLEINQKCTCPHPFYGPHCEFRVYNSRTCSLSCKHNGRCKFGTKKYRDELMFTTLSNRDILNQFNFPTNDNGMYCVCPTGFTGLYCEIPFLWCGSSSTNIFPCFYESTCFELVHNDDSITYHCDCQSINNQVSLFNVLYTGEYCQYAITPNIQTYCDKYNPYACANGGSCPPESELHLGCICTDNYTGGKCEYLFETPRKCTLECQHGGTCMFGKSRYNYGHSLLDDYNEILSISKIQRKQHINFMHCQCPPGYAGITCELEISICDRQKSNVLHQYHICLFGSTCIDHMTPFSSVMNDIYIHNGYSCDCSNIKQENYKGLFCEHPATEFCNTQNGSVYFCTNQGQCRYPTNNKVDPECQCPQGFYGEYCEYPQKIKNIVFSPKSQSIYILRIILIVVAVSIISLLLVIGIILWNFECKEQQQHLTMVDTWDDISRAHE